MEVKLLQQFHNLQSATGWLQVIPCLEMRLESFLGIKYQVNKRRDAHMAWKLSKDVVLAVLSETSHLIG